MDPIETFKHKKLTVKIYMDEDPISPREWDNLGVMVCWHTRYALGDNHTYSTPQEFITETRKNIAVILPLYLYDHSGLGMATRNTAYPFNDPWDAGQVGYIYVTKDRLRHEYDITDGAEIPQAVAEKALKMLQGEVKAYDQFLQGDVYGYVLEDNKGKVDSCWGFYGLEYAIESAIEAATRNRPRTKRASK